MKNQSYKPVMVVDSYVMKKHQNGLFKIVMYYHYSNDGTIRKKVIKKHLLLTDAENKIYQLESKL